MSEKLRVSVKVFVRDGKRYLCAMGAYNPATDRVHAFAMSEEGTVQVALTDTEWNALPFFWFVEDGPAPKPEHRKVTLPESLRPKGT